MEKEKIGFFKRVVISIKDFEKYDIFALESCKESIKYLFTLILIFSIICTIVFGYKFINGDLSELVTQIENEVNSELEFNIEEMQEVMKYNYDIFIIVLFFSILTVYFCSTFIDAVILGVLGIIVGRILRMKINYKATFNIGIYSLTLPVILQLIYLTINLLTGFEVKYFQWMYATISYIYVVVALLMIKTEFINQQMELIKIQMEQEKIKQELQNQEDNDKQEENKKSDKNKDEKEQKDKKEENDEDTNIGEAPEGTNA